MDQALADYDQAISLDPKDADAYSYRSEIYISKRDFEQAISDLDELILLNPNHAYPYGTLGWAYLNLGRYDEAKAIFERASKEKVDYGFDHAGLYAIAFIQGDTTEMQRQAGWGKGTPDEPWLLFNQAQVAASSCKFIQVIIDVRTLGVLSYTRS